MFFEQALSAMRTNRKVYRPSWNGNLNTRLKGNAPVMYLQIVNDERQFHLPYIQLCDRHNRYVPWTITHSDLLADDWEVV
jgi:hypothetical protein